MTDERFERLYAAVVAQYGRDLVAAGDMVFSPEAKRLPDALRIRARLARDGERIHLDTLLD